MTDLSRIDDREKLKPRKGDEPHWQRLRQGCYLGFRPSKRGGRGTWFARVYDADAGRNRRKALGDYPSLVGDEVTPALFNTTQELDRLIVAIRSA